MVTIMQLISSDRSKHVIRVTVLMVVMICITSLLVRQWRYNSQSLCAFSGLLDNKEMDNNCLQVDSKNRPYLEIIIAYQQKVLCINQRCRMKPSTDTRYIMQNYYLALVLPEKTDALPENTIPSSLYLWMQSRFFQAEGNDEQLRRHRTLAIQVDDQWLYDWQPVGAWLEHGHEQYMAGNFDAAAVAYEQSLTRAMNSETVTADMKSAAWLGIAHIAYHHGRIDDAQIAAKNALVINPTNSAAQTLIMTVTP